MLVFATVEFWPAIVDTHIGMCARFRHACLAAASGVIG
jgi:hypothetical protein